MTDEITAAGIRYRKRWPWSPGYEAGFRAATVAVLGMTRRDPREVEADYLRWLDERRHGAGQRGSEEHEAH